MKTLRVNTVALCFFLSLPLLAQEGVPLFTTDFPPEEFAARREAIAKAIGQNALALLQGAPSPEGYVRFRPYLHWWNHGVRFSNAKMTKILKLRLTYPTVGDGLNHLGF